VGNVASGRADIHDLLVETQPAGSVTADFLARVRGDLDAVLEEVHRDPEIVSRHQLDIAEALAYSGDALLGFSSVGYAQGVPVPWNHTVVTGLGPMGVDLIAGCGGLVDQQLDLLLGPDPRGCDDAGMTDGDLDTTAAADEQQVLELHPHRLCIDLGPRSLLAALRAIDVDA